MIDMLPIGLSIAGALIAFLTTCLVGLLAYVGKYALQTVNDRIDDAKARLSRLEGEAASHSVALASAKTQTEAETRRFDEIVITMSDMRDKIDELADAVSELTGQLRNTSNIK